MFTGIIEEVGTLAPWVSSGRRDELHIRAQTVLQDSKIGDSISVNGTCLTLTGIGDEGFSVGIMPETLRRTNLGSLQAGVQVNLERALQPVSRMGGHIVQGHVDATGRVASIVPDGNALTLSIELDSEHLKFVVEKGFVALDGISLTVTKVTPSGFSVALIPFTQEHVSPALMKAGHEANVELDILAKYVANLVLH